MSKPLKIIALVAVVLTFITGSLKLGYYITTKYFFDKIFYQKSVKLGYMRNNVNPSVYGDRMSSLKPLLDKEKNPNVLGASNQNEYVIALIGDSYVWGMGIEEKDTLAKVLEEKLDKVKDTRILQLGYPGDSLVDNLVKYMEIENRVKPDLYIFVTVDNDLLLNDKPRYNEDITNTLMHLCDDVEGDFVYNPKNNLSKPDFEDLLVKSFINPKNMCTLYRVMRLYPKDRAIYFQTTFNPDALPKFYLYPDVMQENGLTLLSASLGRNFQRYKKYFDKERYEVFTVSKREGHPSAFANQMYADILFDEITKNNKWGFVQN